MPPGIDSTISAATTAVNTIGVVQVISILIVVLLMLSVRPLIKALTDTMRQLQEVQSRLVSLVQASTEAQQQTTIAISAMSDRLLRAVGDQSSATIGAIGHAMPSIMTKLDQLNAKVDALNTRLDQLVPPEARPRETKVSVDGRP